MNTQNFCIRSEIIPCKNLDPENVALCALDIGYSAVKGFSATIRSCFPSYVQYLEGNGTELLGNPKATDLYYRDETGMYAVGHVAMESLAANDTNDAVNTLFGRNRYFSPSFKILARVGIAIEVGGDSRPLFLQTGLPPAYRKADTALLKEALSGRHEFELRIGVEPWKKYAFELSPATIGVVDQPIGSVYSASKRSDGTTILCGDGRTYIDHNLLVLDGGFGTLDIYSICNRQINNLNTFNDLGMKAILQRVTDKIFGLYGKEIYVHTIQPYLATGTIPVYDRKNRTSKEISIAPIVEEANCYVCQKAMEKIEAAYDNLENYDYLLVTGGTGSAWLDLIRERYKGMETLSVVPAVQNEKIPSIYSNVRGYYIFRSLAGNVNKAQKA